MLGQNEAKDEANARESMPRYNLRAPCPRLDYYNNTCRRLGAAYADSGNGTSSPIAVESMRADLYSLGVRLRRIARTQC